MKTMNALLKLQEKNLLKYVMFILLTTLLNHDYAIRHVIFYHEWICSRLPIVLKTQWTCFRERTYSNDIHSVLSSHVECVVKIVREQPDIKGLGYYAIFYRVFYVLTDWGDKQVNDPRGYINTQKYVLIKNYKNVLQKCIEYLNLSNLSENLN